MPTSLIIVDDFLEKPYELRNAALGLSYPPQEGAFAGRNSLQRIHLEGLVQQIPRPLPEPAVPIPPLESHAKCRITLAADRGAAGCMRIDRTGPTFSI